MWSLYNIILFYIGLRVVNSIHPSVGLDSYQIITKNGYKYEKHYVQTQDGYILEVIRLVTPITNIYNCSHSVQQREPIILLPGLLNSPEAFILNGPDKSLSFYLLQHGYDVWMPYMRGTKYSKRHVILDPDLNAEEYFDFSVHELAIYDLPAIIDYVLALTVYDKVSLVGHSQGSTIMFAMAAELPEYNKKIKIGISLAGLGIMKYSPNAFTRWIASYEKDLWKIMDRVQIHEALPQARIISDIGKLLVDPVLGFRSFLDLMLTFTNFITTYNMEMDVIPALLSYFPGGSSMKQIYHFMQFINTGEFQTFDYYNETTNIVKYGSPRPHIYDLGKVTAKFVLYYSQDDFFVRRQDTQLMASKMKNAITKNIEATHFGHVDFLVARNVVSLVFQDILWHMNNL